MWICLRHAFISVVQDRADPDGLVVRARKKEHLLRLFPDADIIVNRRADYAARVFVSRAEFTAMLIRQVGEITYPNFKNAVRDRGLHDLYTEFWGLHREYQDRDRRSARCDARR